MQIESTEFIPYHYEEGQQRLRGVGEGENYDGMPLF